MWIVVNIRHRGMEVEAQDLNSTNLESWIQTHLGWVAVSYSGFDEVYPTSEIAVVFVVLMMWFFLSWYWRPSEVLSVIDCGFEWLYLYRLCHPQFPYFRSTINFYGVRFAIWQNVFQWLEGRRLKNQHKLPCVLALSSNHINASL